MDNYKLIRITITNQGGKFSAGLIDDFKLVNLIKDAISNGEISSDCILDRDVEFDVENFNNKINIFGPLISNAYIFIEEAFIKSSSDEHNPDFKEIYAGSLDFLQGFVDKSGIKTFISSDSYFKCSEEELIIFSQKVEKKIVSVYQLKVNENEVFDRKNILFSHSDLDEVAGHNGNYVLEHFFYIPSMKYESIINFYIESVKEDEPDLTIQQLKEDYLEEDELNDKECLNKLIKLMVDDEQFDRNDYFLKKLLINYQIECIYCEGKEESENDYFKIVGKDDELLYES